MFLFLIIFFAFCGVVIINVLLIAACSPYRDYIHRTFPFLRSGAYGERKVSRRLQDLPQDEYRVLDDIILNNGLGTTQIDHIVVSCYGVFVIETKCYTGWIFGREDQMEWRQTIAHYRNRRGETVDRNTFPNPIWQNYKHKKEIEKLLFAQYPKVPVIPIVAFAGDAVLKKVYTRSPVIYDRELVNFILRYNNVIIDDHDLEVIEKLIQEANVQQEVTYTEHIRNLKAEHSQLENYMQRGVCPDCHSFLHISSYANSSCLKCYNCGRTFR